MLQCTTGAGASVRPTDQERPTVVSILLNGCESLAMVGLVVGLLVRHLESAGHLLDPYLTEPVIWHQEFGRVVKESGGFAAGSEELVAPERRNWSLREAARFMAVRANAERAVELRALGENLVANARRHIESTRDDEPQEAEATLRSSMRAIKVRVFPVPGPASIRCGPDSASAATLCDASGAGTSRDGVV